MVAQLTVIVYTWVDGQLLTSATITVNVDVPVTVGVPESRPVDELSVMPVGNVPAETVKV